MAGSPQWLIVGLGNIGDEYANTRHNIGWMVCEAFVRHCGGSFSPSHPLFSAAEIKLRGRSAVVILPTTYMNRSGSALSAAARLYKVPEDHTVVVVDEYNFPVGKVHLKRGGSDGGHNGTASVMSATTNTFWRLRCGIDKDFGPGQLVDYVLAPFSAPQREILPEAIDKGRIALETVLLQGPERAMSFVNSGKAFSS